MEETKVSEKRYLDYIGTCEFSFVFFFDSPHWDSSDRSTAVFVGVDCQQVLPRLHRNGRREKVVISGGEALESLAEAENAGVHAESVSGNPSH